MHDKYIVPTARCRIHRQVWRAPKKTRNFWFDAVDRVDLTRLKSSRSRRRIIDNDDFNAIVVRRITPVVFVPRVHVTYARLIRLKLEWPCANTCSWIVHAAVWLNHKVIIRDQIGQIRVGFIQLNLE